MTRVTATRAGLPQPDADLDSLSVESDCELLSGAIVADKYRVKAVLGRGAFAVVYDAEHIALRRPVALKVLHGSRRTEPQLLERFAREARISALVRHPNVLEVHDAGVLPDGSPFLVMEKISGLTLYERLCTEKRLSVRHTQVLFSQLLKALEALAEHGIVHRDIKPENLMLTRSPEGELQLKLVDFGIALVRDERIEPRLTMQGALVGTPHYMAPEQLRCEVVDARLDLYATGVVMYQALTGRLPYEGGTLSALTSSVLHGKAASITALRPDCPSALVRVIERALARDPEQRFPTASEMRAALEACSEPSAPRPMRRPKLTRILRRLSRPRELVLVLSLLALAVLASEQISFASAMRSAFPTSSSRVEPKATRSAADQEAVSPQAFVEREPSPLAPAFTASGLEEERHVASAEPAAPRSHAPRSPRTRREDAASDHAALSRAQNLERRALSQYLHGELDSAYAMYRQASLLAPTDPAVFRGLGLSASRLGRKVEARRAFAHYLELSPDAADARLIRARLDTLLHE